MKLLFLLLVIADIGCITYVSTYKKIFRSRKKTFYFEPFLISFGVIFLLLGLLGYGLYVSSHATDYFLQGIYF